MSYRTLPATSDDLPSREVTIAAIPDIHFPHADRERLECCLSDLRVRRPEHIVQIGDLGDWYAVSSFDKNPARKETLNDERVQVVDFLRGLRADHPDARIDVCEGNHEDRLRRYLWGKAPAFADLPELTVPSLYGMHDLGIRYHGRNGFRMFGIRFKHGDLVRGKAGYSATAEMEAHRCSGVSGHTHRFGHATRTDKEGFTTDWWEIGHLCDVGAAEYVASPDWQAGYLIINLSPDGIRYEPIYL